MAARSYYRALDAELTDRELTIRDGPLCWMYQPLPVRVRSFRYEAFAFVYVSIGAPARLQHGNTSLSRFPSHGLGLT